MTAARKGLRLVKGERPHHGDRAPANRRVRVVEKEVWRDERKKKTDASISWAAGVKAYRTVMGVTQTQMARAYGVSTATICHWESGYYFGWDAREMERWCQIVNKIATKGR